MSDHKFRPTRSGQCDICLRRVRDHRPPKGAALSAIREYDKAVAQDYMARRLADAHDAEIRDLVNRNTR